MRHFRAHTSLSKVFILEPPPKHSSLNLPAFRSPLYESLVILSICNRERDEGLEHEGGQIMMSFICLFICLSICSVLGLLLDVFVIQDEITIINLFRMRKITDFIDLVIGTRRKTFYVHILSLFLMKRVYTPLYNSRKRNKKKKLLASFWILPFLGAL